MANPLLHSVSRRQVDAYLRHPAHALLLEGVSGVGLHTTAINIALTLGAHAVVEELHPDEKGTISIDSVRTLYALTRTKQLNARVVIIDDADGMGREAQNALLKLLEEPTDNTYFILTTHQPARLLPTIMSRVQKITIRPLPADMTAELLRNVPDAGVKQQLQFMAQGLPAELSRLQADNAYMQKRSTYMKDAKQFITGASYDRLVLASTYASKRDEVRDFLTAVSQLLSFMLLERHQIDMVDKMTATEQVQGRIEQNAHLKTQLMFLALKF